MAETKNFSKLPDGKYFAWLYDIKTGPYLCEKYGSDWFFIDGTGYRENFSEAELLRVEKTASSWDGFANE